MAEKKKAGARGEDLQLSRAALEAIKLLTTVPPEKLCVRAHNGHLDLEGRVHSLQQLRVIEEVTRGLPGVRGVTSVICVEADPEFAEARAMA